MISAMEHRFVLQTCVRILSCSCDFRTSTSFHYHNIEYEHITMMVLLLHQEPSGRCDLLCIAFWVNLDGFLSDSC